MCVCVYGLKRHSFIVVASPWWDDYCQLKGHVCICADIFGAWGILLHCLDRFHGHLDSSHCDQHT